MCKVFTLYHIRIHYTADLLCSMELAKAHLTCYCNTLGQFFLNALLLLDMLTFKTHLVTSVQLGNTFYCKVNDYYSITLLFDWIPCLSSHSSIIPIASAMKSSRTGLYFM